MSQWNMPPDDLPWGWWLRVHNGVIEDSADRTWSTVREAFWVGELGFPSNRFGREQQELMTRVLTAIDARWVGCDERRYDMFDGDMLSWHFFLCWLASIGMLDISDKSDARDAPLSTKGRSVMRMLQATREPDWQDLPMAEVVEALASVDDGAPDEAREHALQEFERSIGERRHVFARERVGRHPVVTLTSFALEARMPTLRVVWSLSFVNERGRDDFFAWIAQRVDRWDDWGILAHDRGQDVLTQKLLTLLIQTGRAAS